MKKQEQKVTVQVNPEVVAKGGNQFSIASCAVMKRYPPLPDCDAVITTFNFQDRHYIVYVKKNVQPTH